MFQYVKVVSGLHTRSMCVATEGLECVFSLNMDRFVSHVYESGQKKKASIERWQGSDDSL